MFDLFKKGMLAGLGAAVLTKESVERTLNELVEKGKISQEEAQATADKMMDQGRHEFEQVRSDFAKSFDDMLSRAQLTPLSDFRRLEARVAALEADFAASRSAERSPEPVASSDSPAQ
ncbi:MAG: phasin family protein [Opitutales bacterium]